jgi:hypothetical protein
VIVFKEQSNFKVFNIFNRTWFRLVKFYINLVSNKKIAIYLNLLYIIFFLVLIHLILIVLSNYIFIGFPYGLLGVDYAIDNNNYENWLANDLFVEKQELLSKYRYYSQKLVIVEKRLHAPRTICWSLYKLPLMGLRMNNDARRIEALKIWSDRWAPWQHEYEGWYVAFLKLNQKLDLIDKAIENKCGREGYVLNRPW